MKRKNSGTFLNDTLNATSATGDTCNGTSIHNGGISKDFDHNGNVYTTSTGTASGTPSKSTKPRTQQQQKEGFLSFFSNQQDPRQIKRIVYPTDKSHHNKKSQRRKMLDTIYAWSIGFICVGLSGMTMAIHYMIPTTTDLHTASAAVSFANIQLPPNDNIPIYILQSTRRQEPISLIPLLLENIVLVDQAEQQQEAKETEAPTFQYPHVQLDNYTDTISSSIPVLGMQYPDEMDDYITVKRRYKDYGDVDLRFLTQDGQERAIYREPWESEGHARSLNQPRDDDVEEYWAFDDDWLRNPYVAFDDQTIHERRRCRRNNWTRKSFPTGNILHEIDRVRNMPELIGEGAYREVFIVENNFLEKEENFVLKEIHYSLKMEYDCHEYVRVDALITERMTYNEQIVNIYGFVGLSMITEIMRFGDIEDDVVGFEDRHEGFKYFREPKLKVLNNFTGPEKLKLALSMVEPLAALHNYEGGVIVHDDIQLSQYLWTDETKTAVKLNDFNRAEVMFWDDENEEYCRYRNGRGHGDWRAPEEYKDGPLNEKIDIFSLGNNFYSVLTGYYPFPDIEDNDFIKEKLIEGMTGKIDPRFLSRSFGENQLVQIIEYCWAYSADDRPSINELHSMLEEAIAEDERLALDNYTEWHYVVESDSEEGEDEYSHSDYEHSDEDSHSDYEHSEESESDYEHSEESESDYEEEESHADHEYEEAGNKNAHDTEASEQHLEEEGYHEDYAGHDESHHEDEAADIHDPDWERRRIEREAAWENQDSEHHEVGEQPQAPEEDIDGHHSDGEAHDNDYEATAEPHWDDSEHGADDDWQGHDDDHPTKNLAEAGVQDQQ